MPVIVPKSKNQLERRGGVVANEEGVRGMGDSPVASSFLLLVQLCSLRDLQFFFSPILVFLLITSSFSFEIRPNIMNVGGNQPHIGRKLRAVLRVERNRAKPFGV